MAKTNAQLQAEYEAKRRAEGRGAGGQLYYSNGDRAAFATPEFFNNPIAQQTFMRRGATVYDHQGFQPGDERWSIVPRNTTYWRSPQRIARYKHALDALPPGTQPPPWADPEAINFAYDQLSRANRGRPWYTWDALPDGDSLASWLDKLPPPPPEAMPAWEQDYFKKLYDAQEKQRADRYSVDRDSIYRALYMQRPSRYWVGEPDEEKRQQLAQEGWESLVGLSQEEFYQRLSDPEYVPTMDEWRGWVREAGEGDALDALTPDQQQAEYQAFLEAKRGGAVETAYTPSEPGQAQEIDWWTGAPKDVAAQMDRDIWLLNVVARHAPNLMPWFSGLWLGYGTTRHPLGAVGGALVMGGGSEYVKSHQGIDPVTGKGNDPDWLSRTLEKIFTALDVPFQGLERVGGFMNQLGEFDPSDPTERMAAWRAGDVFYDLMGRTKIDEQGRLYVNLLFPGDLKRTRLYFDVDPDSKVGKVLAERREEIKRYQEKFGPGAIPPDILESTIIKDAGAAYVMGLFRENLLAGMDTETALQLAMGRLDPDGRYSMEIHGLVQDMIAGFLLDPMDWVAPYSSKLVGKAAGLAGNKTAAKAYGASGDLLTGSRLYGQMIRAMSPDEAAHFGALSRFIAGVDKQGQWRDYSAPLNSLFGLTPQARATQLLNQSVDSFQVLFEGEKDPTRMVGLLEAVSAAGPEGAVEAGAKTVKIEVGGQAVDVELPRWFSSVEAQPVPLAVRDLLPKARDLLESWHLSRADAAILKTVADTLDMDLAQLIADLHSGKLNGDVALRQYVDTLTRMAGEGNAAAQTMLKGIQTSQGRGLNGAALKAKADSFAKGELALTVDQFRAQLELLLAEGIDRWAVTRFGVKPSNWVVRLSNVVKRMQGMLLLGWSPTYALNNAINNYVTLSWDGALGFHTPASNARFIEEMGFSPTRLRQGSGMADLGAVGETEIGAAIRQAQRAEDRIQMLDDLLRGTNKLQPFVALSQKIEQAASHTAMVTGMREFWNLFWKAGDGFDRLPDELAAMLEAVQPGLSQKIEQAIERGKSKAQIEKEIFASLERRSLREVMTADQFALLDSLAPGLADDLDADLARARTDNEVRDAISKAQMRLVESARERVTAAISRRIEEARQKAGTEGLQGVLDMLDQTIHERIDFWLEHFERIDQAVAAADAAGLPVDWASLNAREDVLFNQYENTYGAQWLGVFEALGAGQMTDTGVRVMKLMTDMRDNWQAFYTRRRELFEDYRQKISSLPGRKERTPDQQVQAADWWEEVNRKLNNEYLQAVLEEDRLQGQFDTMFAEAFNRQFGEDPGRFSGGAERWRSAVRQVRRQQVAAMVTYRFGQLPESLRSAWGDVLTAEQLAYIQKINGGQPIYTMPWANRSKAQKEFYKKVYTTLIRRSLEASHANMPGTRVKVEASELAAEGPEAARSPQSPVEAETGGEGTVTTLAEPQQMPPETAQDRAAARLGELMGEGVDRANALNRVAEELGLSPENIEAVNATAAANEARQIASEYGIPTATEAGQQGDEPLLAILRQYGYAVDGLEGVDPGLVREVLERHKQALEAVSPEQQAEIDRRIVLERAEQLRANTERLLLESYKKQGRKATVRAVEDHFAEKYPDDPAKAQQMSRAVVAIWDAIGTTWARQNGRTLEDWYEGFILERGGTAIGGEWLRQSDNRLIALHNISADDLMSAIELGGLPMPSIAVTRPEVSFEYFGEVTLVGKRDLVDPQHPSAQVRVFDADIYSPTFPDLHYRPIPRKAVEAVADRLRAAFDEVGEGLYLISYMEGANPSRDDFVYHLKNSNGGMLAFLREKGIDFIVPLKEYEWAKLGIDQQFLDWYRENRGRLDNYDFREPFTQQFLASAERTGQGKRFRRVLSGDGLISGNFYNMLIRDLDDNLARGYQVDTDALQDQLKAKVAEHQAEFNQWVDELASVYGEPYILVGRSKRPLTLANVVEAMLREKLKGSEKGLTYGPARARAMGAREFKSVEDMRARSDLLKPREEVQAFIDGRQAEVLDHYAEQLAYKYRYPDTWDRLNSTYKALGDFLRGRSRSRDAMYRALINNDFTNLTDSDINLAMEAARVLAETPTQYFEAKPRRAVSLDQFAGAVVPKDADPRLFKQLESHGLAYQTYDPDIPGDRQRAIAAFHGQPDVLFQGPKGATRWLEDGTAVIHAFQKADVYTLMHETAHIWLPMLGADDLAVVARWLKNEYGLELPAGWQNEIDTHRQALELFARGFERYLAEGRAPSRKLRAVFDQFKAWMLEIYKAITGSQIDVKLNDEIRALFDRWLGEEEAQAAPEPVAPAPVAEKPLTVVRTYDAFKEKRAPKEVKGISARDEEIVGFSAEAYSDYMVQSDETGRKLRWVYVLSDGRQVSADGVVRILRPEAWETIKKWSREKRAKNIWKYLPEDARLQSLQSIDWDQIFTEEMVSKSKDAIDTVRGPANSKLHLYAYEQVHPVYNFEYTDLVLNHMITELIKRKFGVENWFEVSPSKVSEDLGLPVHRYRGLLEYYYGMGLIPKEFAITIPNLREDAIARMARYAESARKIQKDAELADFYQGRAEALRQALAATPAPVAAAEPSIWGKPKYRQMGMFEAGEDSPLFSGVAMTAKDEVYTPPPAAGPSLFDTREYLRTIEGKTVEDGGDMGPLFEDRDTLFQTAPPTESAEFWRWFGDSKVVDENGNPLVVYHGTPTGGFEAFKPKYAKNQDLPFGIHFAEDKAFADTYTFDKRKGRGVPGKNPQTYAVYLSIQNLLDLTQIAMPGSPEYELAAKISPIIKKQAFYRNGVFLKNIIDQSNNPQRVERLIREAGYDGIKYNAENRNWVGPNQYIPMEKSIAYVVFDPTQVKAVANRGTWDPNDPRILYQEDLPAVGAPLGTADSLQEMPVELGLLELVYRSALPALDEAAYKLTGEGAQRATMGDLEKLLGPENMNELRRYLGKVYMQMKDVKLGSLRWGEAKRDMALLDYNRRTNADTIATALFPYQFWYTRSMMNWGLRALARPGILSHYLRLASYGQYAQERDDYPERLRGKAGFPLPWIPEWLGGGVYVDPMRQIFPFHQMMTPLKAWSDQMNLEDRRAESLVSGWIDAEEVDAEEGRAAIESRSGPLWDRALAQVRVEDGVGYTNPLGVGSDRRIRNPIDMLFQFMSPSLPLTFAYDLATGRKDLNKLPITRTIQSATRLLGVGGERGLDLGKPFRRAVGLPEDSRLEDYYVDRELANMVGDGTIDKNTAIQAMIERSGEAFTRAQRRVNTQQGWRGLLGALALDFFPEGERENRALREEYYRALEAKDAGQEDALELFWEAHPEYEAQRAAWNWDDPESRLRMFTRNQVWEGWNALSQTEKKVMLERLGEVFQDSFLDKETRNYDNIPTEMLIDWARMLRGEGQHAPAEAGTDAPDAVLQAVRAYDAEMESKFPGIRELWELRETLGLEQQKQLRAAYPMLDEFSVWQNRYLAEHPEVIPYVIGESNRLSGLPGHIQQAVYAFRAERDRLFPGIFDTQSKYFAINSKSDRRSFLAAHPELKAYWSWTRAMGAANIEAAPYMLSEATLQKAILGDEYQEMNHPPYLTDDEWAALPPELLRELAAYVYGDGRLGSGARAELEAMRDRIAPALDLDVFIEMYIKSALEVQ